MSDYLDTSTNEPQDAPATQHAPIDEDDLQAQLVAYRAALSQEFEIAESKSASIEDSELNIKTFTRKNLAFYLAEVDWLSRNSSNDGVKLSASKYLIGLAREDSTKDGDPLKGLLKELQGNDSKPQPEHSIS